MADIIFGSGISIGTGISITPPPLTIPDAPTIGSATATSATTATVAFTAPINNGGSTITSYTATSSPGSITGTLSQAGSGTITVSGLSASTSYTFTVTATNAIGTSSPSSASNSITTPALQDSYFMYNTMLLPGNGTNNAQNNTFLDGSTNNYTITRNGNTTQGTFTPYGSNWSVYFNGTSDYLTVPSNAALQFGTGDFTVELWFYLAEPISNSNGKMLIDGRPDGINGNYWNIGFSNTGSGPGFTSGANNTGVSGVVAGQWYHFAATRSGTTLRTFLNGVLGGTMTDSTNLTTSGTIKIGDNAFHPGDTLFNGYISNVRIIKGTALYTTSFTPSTTPLTAISGTGLLTCQSSTLADNSLTAQTVSLVGTPRVQRFSPFAPSTVTPTSYSGYFDGTGDVLTPPANNVFAFGTGSFCIEAWIFNNVLKNYSCLVTTRPNNGSYADAYHIGWDSVGGVSLYVNTTPTTGAPSGTITTGQWQHFVCCRDSSNRTAIFVNGTRVGNDTVTSNFTRNLLGIGDFPTTPAEGINGYISNLRLVKGNSVYDPTQTTITVPTSPLTTTSQGVTASTVSILTCQSPTFIDNSTNNFTITAVGNSQPTQQNPFGYTSALTNGYTANTVGGSGYFDGTGDTIANTTGNPINFGTAAFTIELWFYMNAVPATSFQVLLTTNPQSNNGFQIYRNGTSGSIVYGGINLSENVIIPSASFSAGKWYHIAVCRSGTGTNQTKTYVNGTLSNQYTDAGNYSINGFTIGGYNTDIYFPGYISDLRAVKGTAVYTSAFTPPTAPVTAIANTSLLTNFTNAAIIDNAMINTIETVANAKISTTQSKFGGSSMSFDGTDDSLNIFNNYSGILGTRNFTVEAWVYTTVSSGTQCVYDTRQTNDSTAGFYFGLISANTLLFYTGGAFTINAGTISANTWTHIALVRVGNTFTGYINGTSVGTATNTNNFTSTVVQIGSSDRVTSSSVNYFNGYIDDLRVTKGVARYTSNFTPPTQAFPTY